MSDVCETVRIESTDKKSQGDFVEINKKDFDEKKHTLYKGKVPDAPPPAAKLPEKPINDGLLWASNSARDKAIASGLDFTNVKGTGADGKITAADVQGMIDVAESAKAFDGVKFENDAVKELAEAAGLTVDQMKEIKGTGVDGVVTSDDVEKFVDTL